MIFPSTSTMGFESLYQGRGPASTNPIVEKGTVLGDLAEASGGAPTGGYRGLGLGLPALVALLALALAFAYIY